MKTIFLYGDEEAKEVKAGIYSYIDDANDIICYSEIRQVDKTKVTNESKDIFLYCSRQ